MSKCLPITADADAFLPVRNTLIKGVLLCAAAANAVIEIYDAATVAAGVSAGSSVAKLACVANESAPPLYIDCGILTTNGVSVDITGAGAKAFLIYD